MERKPALIRLPIIDTYVEFVRHNRDYRNLWYSQIISLMGDWFNLIASAALIAKLSGSGLAIGGIFLARLLPPLLLGPFVGVVADRFDRRKILIASDLLRTGVVLAFLLVRSEADIWLIYLLTVLQFSISAFFEPTRAALLPSLVPRRDLVTANALSSTTWSTMLALGAAMGGLATALFGITTAFILDALTFVLSAWFITRISAAGDAVDADSLSERQGGWQEFVKGVRYLRQHPPILVVALLKASSALAYGGMMVIEVTYAEQIFPIFGSSSATLGLIYVAAGLGTGFGPIVTRRLTGDNPLVMQWALLFAYLLSFVGFVTIGWAASLPLLLFGTFLRTIESGVNWVFSSAILQMAVPGKFLGRVFAFDFAMMTLAASLSTLWVGWAQDNQGLPPADIVYLLSLVPLVMATGWLAYLMLYLRRQQALSS
ncbi:MAG: MFS transporter [Anaerolineae bacterium]|nr:MFS transporter [Anaerolineae bacterium]